MLLALLGCHPDDPTPPAPGTGLDTTPPTIAAPELVLPTGEVGGARLLRFTTDRPTTATVEVEGPEGTRTLALPGMATLHEVPLVGFRPQQAYTVRAAVQDAEGLGAVTPDLGLVGDSPPPLGFPEMLLLEFDGTRVGEGWTFFTAQQPGSPGCWAILLDSTWQPVWWAHWAQALGDVELTAQGTLLGLGEYQVVEQDFLGNVVRRLSSTQAAPAEIMLDAQLVHHEITALDDGTYVTIGSRLVEVAEYPTDYADPTGALAPATIVDSAIVRFDVAGRTLQEIDLADVLDTSRIGFGSLEVGEIPGGLDWARANAVDVDPVDGSWLVTVRNQDVLAQFDADGGLRWLLGDPAGWSPPQADALLVPTGPAFRWPYHAHGGKRIDGGVLVYDNGNDGHTPYGPAPVDPVVESRVVAFDVDEQAGTVSQRWEWTTSIEGPLYGSALGDADALPGGSVLATFGFLAAEDGQSNLAAGRGAFTARIAEFDPASPVPTIAELRVGSVGTEAPTGWLVYRAARFPTLYPQLER